MTMRVVFMGSPAFSVPALAEIIGAGHEVVAVYAQPPRPAGRGQDDRKQPVHEFAERAGLPVHTPRNLKAPEALTQFRAHDADVAVVIAYGLILPQDILDCPRHGCLNMHASALPRWRGAAPIQRAIMAGDTVTAANVMRMEAGLDTGPVCLIETVAITADMTTGALHDALSSIGARLVVRALGALERGSLIATPQSTDGVTYAHKIEKAECRIDFGRTAEEVHNHIRGLSPHPGAWFDVGPVGKPERIKVLRCALSIGVASSGTPGLVLDDQLTIACGNGAVRLIELQRAGKRPMPAIDLLRGFALGPGTVLNCTN